MRVIVCGAGQVGTTIARHLSAEGVSVTVIDTDSERVRLIDESHDIRGVVGHGSHPEVLRAAGAMDADMLIAVTRSDEVNMVACQVAYSLFNVKRRLARLRHSGYESRDSEGLYAAEHLPIDVIISPEAEVAQSIARRLVTPGAFDIVPMAGGLVELLAMHVLDVNCPAVGERVQDIAADEDYQGLSIVALARKGRMFIPDPGDRIEVGDDVHAIVPSDRLDAAMTLFGHHERMARSVLLVGGGNVGLHLASRIARDFPGINLHIIERDKERAGHIAGMLGTRATVLLGDALDRGLLEEAHAGSKDTLVAVTNDDETNIFTSVLAKQIGCKRAITLVNKRSYEELIPSLGIRTVVSPSAVTVSTVLRHVRRGPIEALHTLREDFGEVVEVTVDEGSRLLQPPCVGLELPVGMKIGALVRNGKVVMPASDTRIQAGDHVIVLVTYANLRMAEAILGGSRRRLL